MGTRRNIPDEIVDTLYNLIADGASFTLAARLIGLSEHGLRYRRKHDPRFKKLDEAAEEGRTKVLSLICKAAIKALDDPHGRNALHWAAWLKRVHALPVPEFEPDPVSINVDGRVVVNAMTISRQLEADTLKAIEAKSVERKLLPNATAKTQDNIANGQHDSEIVPARCGDVATDQD